MVMNACVHACMCVTMCMHLCLGIEQNNCYTNTEVYFINDLFQKLLQSKQHDVTFWATVCKTVRPMRLDRCLSVLSVTLVYCGQTVAWIKMKPGTVVW